MKQRRSILGMIFIMTFIALSGCSLNAPVANHPTGAQVVEPELPPPIEETLDKMADFMRNAKASKEEQAANIAAGRPDAGSDADKVTKTAKAIGGAVGVIYPPAGGLVEIGIMSMLGALGVAVDRKRRKEKAGRLAAQEVIKAVNESKDTPSVTQQVSEALRPAARKALSE